jgi:acyl-CoA thioester hydrolase
MSHIEFKHTVRVPYAHTDQMGFVYYANYLVYFEMARSEMMREAGTPYGDLEKRGVVLPVVEAHTVYRSPARFDDLLEIRSRCSEIRGVRLRIEYRVLRGAELLATGYTEHVCMSPAGKVQKPAPEFRRLLEWTGA